MLYRLATDEPPAHTPDVIPLVTRPRTRADCIDGPRPCPWAGCRYHLLVYVEPSTGELTLPHGHDDPTLLAQTCALDQATQRQSYNAIGAVMGRSKELPRLIAINALKAIKASPWAQHVRLELAEGTHVDIGNVGHTEHADDERLADVQGYAWNACSGEIKGEAEMRRQRALSTRIQRAKDVLDE